MSAQMDTEVLLVEPPGRMGDALAILKVPRLQAQAEVQAVMARRSLGALLWITPTKAALSLLLQTLPARPLRDCRLLALNDFNHKMMNLLHAHFRYVVSTVTGVQLLPVSELAEVLSSDQRADVFIGGEVIEDRSELLLYRGNLEPLTLPLSWFKSRPASPQLDVQRLAITDYGQTIRLGEYEAATDAILYEFDEDFRFREKRRSREQDTSLGGALRRLRLAKGLRQCDFPGVTAKEIARIENGLVKTPREETLRKIAKKAGVTVEAISTY